MEKRKKSRYSRDFSHSVTGDMKGDVSLKYFKKHTRNFDKKDSLNGNILNISLLLLLYVLQGIPLGLAGSVPMILQKYKISYKDQALFSFVQWPFSLKLLWAPVVDSVYLECFGRRKSWLIPSQYCIGIFMLMLSGYISSLIGNSEHMPQPNITVLTIVFFALNFLAATQDIAVDGWALTMLPRNYVGYASTCNSVGQTAGYFIGNVVFQALESADFCNTYIHSVRKEHGIVTFSGFLSFWGIVFVVTTTVIMFLKKEHASISQDSRLNVKDTYMMLYHILCLPSVRTLAIILLTCKVGFSATDAVTGLKLIDAGIKREHLAFLAIPMVPLQILLPFIISRYTSGPKPLSVFLKAYPYRLILGVLLASLVSWTHQVKTEAGTFPTYYYFVIVMAYAVHQVTVYSIFVSLMAFFAQVSDPAIGGTYMTLLNTVCNLGGNWPNTVALWYIDPLTVKMCQNALSILACYSDAGIKACSATGGQCVTHLDGYYVETVICIAFGVLWLKWAQHRVWHLQYLPPSSWTVS